MSYRKYPSTKNTVNVPPWVRNYEVPLAASDVCDPTLSRIFYRLIIILQVANGERNAMR